MHAGDNDVSGDGRGDVFMIGGDDVVGAVVVSAEMLTDDKPKITYSFHLFYHEKPMFISYTTKVSSD